VDQLFDQVDGLKSGEESKNHKHTHILVAVALFTFRNKPYSIWNTYIYFFLFFFANLILIFENNNQLISRGKFITMITTAIYLRNITWTPESEEWEAKMKMKNSNIDRKNPKLKKELTFKKNV